MKNRFMAWDFDTIESIPVAAKGPTPITHGDIGKNDIKALCGIEPDGEEWFTPVFADEPLPSEVNCPKCRQAFEVWKKGQI